MAGRRLIAQAPEMATGTSKKTILQIVAPANQRLVVNEWSVSFEGTSNTEPPIQVDVIRQTDAGLDGDALTLVKMDDDVAGTIQATAQTDVDGSTQPAEGGLLMSEKVHPQGAYTWQAQFGNELVIGGGDRLGIAVSAPNNVNCTARIVFEE